MKHSPALIQRQRVLLDVRLKKARLALEHLATPRGGWIKTTRESLGMTQAQLARRMGVTQSVVAALERSELRKAVSLSSLERAAGAMNCKLVWALHPAGSLDALVDARAREVALRQLRRTAHSMALEGQTPDADQTAVELEELARAVKNTSQLWSEE